MYKTLRDLHLILGLFSAVFLLAYALSAVQMAYPIRDFGEKESRRMVEVPTPVDTGPRPLARWLMDEHGLRGDLTRVSSAGDTVNLTIVRPGTSHQIRYDGRKRTAEVTTSVLDTVGMMNRIHHQGGVWHDYWAIDAWGWFLLAVSISLLLLAATGLVMWFSRHRERRSGAILLAAGLTWGATLLILVRSA